ncbi:Uncharacterised protein [Mycobacterium tuberculosis]|nr:Uncharacterised protein [Mycobacterium tuberculosis]
MRSRDIVGDEAQLHAQRLGRGRCSNMPLREIRLRKLVRGKGEGGLAGREFAVGVRIVEELAREAEGLFEELKRLGDVGNVDDGVAEFHGCRMRECAVE